MKLKDTVLGILIFCLFCGCKTPPVQKVLSETPSRSVLSETTGKLKIYFPEFYDEEGKVYNGDGTVIILPDNKVIVIDESKSLYDMSLKIINIITIVLVSFSSISLFVSSIMIGIITYISVLERKKEIGILRSMGVSKKSIRYLFLMENIILGFISGITGIFISILFSAPINAIFNSLIEANNIFSMRLPDNILLIILSMFLSMIGAYIPSKKASSNDIITSLEYN